MNICVVGWYYTIDFYGWIEGNDRVFVIEHRSPENSRVLANLKHAPYPNEGLEFGAYEQYLRHHWSAPNDVLFIQDDTRVLDPAAFDHIASLKDHGIQMAYIFSSEYEEIAMGGAHGRAIYCSAEFLWQLQDMGGFPYDAANHGVTTGPNENVGIMAFARRAKLIGNLGIGTVAIIPGIQHGRRGNLNSEPYFFDRKSRDSCTILTQGTAQPMISSLRK